jgi:hypothetical protein
MKSKKDKKDKEEPKETKAQANKRNFAGSNKNTKQEDTLSKLSKVEYGEFYNKNIIYKRPDGTTLTVVYDGSSKEYINRTLHN